MCGTELVSSLPPPQILFILMEEQVTAFAVRSDRGSFPITITGPWRMLHFTVSETEPCACAGLVPAARKRLVIGIKKNAHAFPF